MDRDFAQHGSWCKTLEWRPFWWTRAHNTNPVTIAPLPFDLWGGGLLCRRLGIQHEWGSSVYDMFSKNRSIFKSKVYSCASGNCPWQPHNATILVLGFDPHRIRIMIKSPIWNWHSQMPTTIRKHLWMRESPKRNWTSFSEEGFGKKNFRLYCDFVAPLACAGSPLFCGVAFC